MKFLIPFFTFLIIFYSCNTNSKLPKEDNNVKINQSAIETPEPVSSTPASEISSEKGRIRYEDFFSSNTPKAGDCYKSRFGKGNNLTLTKLKLRPPIWEFTIDSFDTYEVNHLNLKYFNEIKFDIEERPAFLDAHFNDIENDKIIEICFTEIPAATRNKTRYELKKPDSFKGRKKVEYYDVQELKHPIYIELDTVNVTGNEDRTMMFYTRSNVMNKGKWSNWKIQEKK